MRRRSWLRRELVVSDEEVAAARRRLAAVGAVVVALDLVVKTVTDAPQGTGHHRPVGQLLTIAAIVAYAGYVLPLAGARRIATAGGLMVGAGVGNVVSALIWGAIPNPFTIEILSVAFNLADVAAVVGVVLLVSGVRRLSARPRPEPRTSPPPPVRQTQPVRHEDWRRTDGP